MNLYARALEDVALCFERTRDQWMEIEGTPEWDPWAAHAYGEAARVLRSWADEPWRMRGPLRAVHESRECNGLCLTGHDIGVPSDGIAAAHPDCPKHGDLATHEIDGTPRDGRADERPWIAVEAIRALLDVRDREHAEYVRQVQAGELITLDRFIGPAQVLVREVREIIDGVEEKKT